MIRLLRSSDLEGHLTFETVIDAVEAAYEAIGAGELTGAPRTHLASRGTHTFLNVTPAMSAELGICVFAYTGGNKGKAVPQKVALLFDPDDGGLRCVIESDLLSWLRTGATSAVATRHLARRESKVVGVIGSGKQARSQLLAVAHVVRVEQAVVFSLRPERREAYAAEMSEQCGFPVLPVDSAAAVIEIADVICTATNSRLPVLQGSLVRPGTHVNAIGQHYPDRRELDTAAIARSRTFVDDRESALANYGELLLPIGEGELRADHLVASLGEVVTGTAAGRTSRDDVTVFLSGGIGAEYLAAAHAAWRVAERHGLGTEVDLLS